MCAFPNNKRAFEFQPGVETGTPPSASSGKARIGWFVFTLLACAQFTIAYVWRGEYFLNLPLYASGGERLPYQGRIFMAWIFHLTSGNPHIGPKLMHLAAHLPAQYRSAYAPVMLVVTFLSMFAAVLATRASLLHLTQDRRFASWASLLTLYMAFFNLIQVAGLTYILPYDVPSLALFCVAVWLILSQRYWTLLPIFFLGTLNRETFCFITIFLALYTWFALQQKIGEHKAFSQWLRTIAPHVVLQTIIWVGIRLWVNHHFAHNLQDSDTGTGLFSVHLKKNLRSTLNPMQWPLFLSLFGFTLPLFFCCYRWIADRALAKSAAILFLLWLVLMMLVGVVVEVRIFDELTSFLAPIIGLILWNRWVRPANQSIYGKISNI